MALIHLKNISLAFGVAPVLDHVSFSLDKGERVCLIGRNGEGKSTLFKLIDGTQAPDDGEIIIADSIKVAMLAQDVPSDDGTLLDIVMNGDEKVATLLRQYHDLSDKCTAGDMTACERMTDVQHEIDALHGWELERNARTLLDNMGLNPTGRLADLSGGRKRRVLLARALVVKPDVLLLDEPTNHLDVESIDWLENYLLGQNLTVLFITHDRKFVDNLATRIVELDRGKLSTYDVTQGVKGYARYQELKELELASEAKSFEEFDKKLAQEEVWIRQGIKARRTRNEGRVRALKALREERKQRRDVVGSVSLTQNVSEKSGKIVCEVKDLSLQYDSKILVKNFSTLLMRGDKVGIIGNNGVGKTTLIRTVLGLDDSAKVGGTVKLGTNLNIAFFDQLKDQLDFDKSVAENVSEGSDYVDVGGRRTHILGYLQDFLFTPNRARTPVKALSGGEKARVLLAKNLLKPANVLVLDEPTNDLDMATLELLEEFVAGFDGTILLISHDRTFMDNVVTQTWVFGTDKDGHGVIDEYVGGYQDYLTQKARSEPTKPKVDKAEKSEKTEKSETVKTDTPKPEQKRKLSYKEQRELESLPNEIAELENEQSELNDKLADVSLFVSDLALATQYSERLGEIDEILMEKLERWDELENLVK
ncbi:ATP-binding cassette domain-containing protein [Moraxella bovis]|uniref:ATP-binding cassette domain-containing protein n=1 Tax=Moraxella bovis TaxID=476 RepID=UPI0022265590|nr:ATP-binding cassette domain-containing protein [Moraxella bovis]UYZ71595.1 ATP-binding cassette domain-containing protein [Moraxella bovis]UYZ72491.1 ATP-binding cassette domain-containing protein [Moraxella bovis]UZA14890.1 ATP-binding cassette domain-containing protein [Moraxella bovis]